MSAEREGVSRTWVSARPISLRTQLSGYRKGAGDPSVAAGSDLFVKAWQTPEGPGTLALRCRPGEGSVEAQAWGPAAGWLLDGVPQLLGDGDDIEGFEPLHPAVAQAWRTFAHWRVSRSRCVLDALAQAIIEQKVTGQEAFRGIRDLTRRFGEPAPGPWGARLMVAPTAAQWAAVPSWAWLQASVDGARSRAVVSAARVSGRLEQGSSMPLGEAHRRLRAVPGVGVWTAAEVAQRAWGDPDSPSFGDYHVAKNIGWALTGEPVDDAGMAELLEPYRGHRYRVQRLLELAGYARPRHGARMPPRTHLPTATPR